MLSRTPQILSVTVPTITSPHANLAVVGVTALTGSVLTNAVPYPLASNNPLAIALIMENGCVKCVRAVAVDVWIKNVPTSAATILMDIVLREIAGNPVKPVDQGIAATTRKGTNLDYRLQLSTR